MAKHLRKSNKLKKPKTQKIGFVNYNRITVHAEFVEKINTLMMRDLMKVEDKMFFGK